jgi:hypothetical protein
MIKIVPQPGQTARFTAERQLTPRTGRLHAIGAVAVLSVNMSAQAAAANGSNRMALGCPALTDINALTCSDDRH